MGLFFHQNEGTIVAEPAGQTITAWPRTFCQFEPP
jgi:hypothetical protein